MTAAEKVKTMVATMLQAIEDAKDAAEKISRDIDDATDRWEMSQRPSTLESVWHALSVKAIQAMPGEYGEGIDWAARHVRDVMAADVENRPWRFASPHKEGVDYCLRVLRAEQMRQQNDVMSPGMCRAIELLQEEQRKATK